MVFMKQPEPAKKQIYVSLAQHVALKIYAATNKMTNRQAADLAITKLTAKKVKP